MKHEKELETLKKELKMEHLNHLEIVKKLEESGFEALLVGGCVRDALLNLEPDDFDIVTNANTEEIQSLFPNCKTEMGTKFKVNLVDGIEVATYRKDAYNINGELVVVDAKTSEEDSTRRDLTINSLYQDSNGVIFDFHNGIEDLKNKVIKFVGNPMVRISQDPVRILRACRFVASIDGVFDPETFRALSEAVRFGELSKVAPERIRKEILKAMKIKKASQFFEALHYIGALELIFPSMDSCWEHEHGNHHIENVWDHCMAAGDHISSRFPILKLAGYLHDCGKPEAFNPETKQFLFHEVIGATLAKKELKALKFSSEEVAKVWGLIRSHMHSVQKMSPKAIRKFLKSLNERNVSVNEFFRIRLADRKANLKHEMFPLSKVVEMYRSVTNPAVVNVPFNVKALAISGGELIKELNLKPGIIVGETQAHLLKFVIERGPSHNNKKLLLIVAERFIFGN